MPNKNFFLIITYFIVLIPSLGFASTYDRAFIEMLAKNYLEEKISPPEGGKVSISITKLDPRIIIKPCHQALTANIPEKDNGRNVNVEISCDDPIPWRLYIPAKIEQAFAVLVAVSTIEKGMLLTDENIAIEYLPTNMIRGKKLTEKTGVVGSKATKRIGKGRAIASKHVCLVCKGDAVTIIAKTNNFLIKARGTALSSGNINQQIRVKNTRSGKIIRPKVIAINQVMINL
ncbi:MAG: flagellar basal body P-ring formation chaperone FlgA [Litorilituus sp.]|jgi:flagella basal body P-ring formation protein FlgA|nr:flagellar basal body P-ring formation chaperone FlgA [Litorilituus sp.]